MLMSSFVTPLRHLIRHHSLRRIPSHRESSDSPQSTRKPPSSRCQFKNPETSDLTDGSWIMLCTETCVPNGILPCKKCGPLL